MRRGLVTTLAVAASLLALEGAADAAWEPGGAGTSYGKAQAMPLATGNAPSVSVSGRNVTVSWTNPGGSVPIDGYVVKRYADGGGGEQTVGADCSGIVSGLSCTEKSVDPGSWQYTVTAARHSWRGGESPRSSAATVGSPNLSLNTTTFNALPGTSGGQITNFKSGQTVTYRLDNPNTGTVLTGSITPSPVPSNGAATVSVTIPAGTSNGSHTVYAIGSNGDQASASITLTRPQVAVSVIAKSSGGSAGHIRQGGTYFVYANVSGTGDPPAGLSTLRADVSAITSGQTSVTMTHGSFTVGGQSYNYRSAQLTANAILSGGSKSYSLTVTDTAGSTTTSNHTVNVDNSPPTGTDIQTTNVSGGTAGRAELGDSISYTFSEEMETSGWDGSPLSVVVRLNNAGGNDTVTVYNAANSTQLPLGTVQLAQNYVTANRTFGVSGTPSTMTLNGSTVAITLGTASGAVNTVATASAMLWTPSSGATDRAGNACLTTLVTESGASDVNF